MFLHFPVYLGAFAQIFTIIVLNSQRCIVTMQYVFSTIELLESHGEHDLVSQASNELANLYFHLGNTKSAFKWWKHSLDQVIILK